MNDIKTPMDNFNNFMNQMLDYEKNQDKQARKSK